MGQNPPENGNFPTPGGVRPPGDPPAPPPTPPGFPGDIFFEGWIGPLPPPEELEKFNAAVPGAGARIVDEFVEQGKHRRGIEKKNASTNAFTTKVIASIPWLAMAGAVVAVVSDQIILAILFGLISVFMLATLPLLMSRLPHSPQLHDEPDALSDRSDPPLPPPHQP